MKNFTPDYYSKKINRIKKNVSNKINKNFASNTHFQKNNNELKPYMKYNNEIFYMDFPFF